MPALVPTILSVLLVVATTFSDPIGYSDTNQYSIFRSNKCGHITSGKLRAPRPEKQKFKVHSLLRISARACATCPSPTDNLILHAEVIVFTDSQGVPGNRTLVKLFHQPRGSCAVYLTVGGDTDEEDETRTITTTQVIVSSRLEGVAILIFE